MNDADLTHVVKDIETQIDGIIANKSEDAVNHPSHYETGEFECIEIMIEIFGTIAVKDFCVCNAFKYLYRHKRKGGDEDIAKANWYLNKFIELGEHK